MGDGSPRCRNFPACLRMGIASAEAMARAEVLALRVIADRLEHGEVKAFDIRISLPAVA